MFVTTEDLEPQLTGRTKHGAACGISLPPRRRAGSASTEDNNLQLHTQHPAHTGIRGVFQITAEHLAQPGD